MVSQSPQIFLSYASADMIIKDELVRYLAGALGENLALSFGEEKMWMLQREDQQSQINRADILLVLASGTYLRSPVQQKEMIPFLKKMTEGKRLLLLIIDNGIRAVNQFPNAFAFPRNQDLSEFFNRNPAYEQVRRAISACIELYRNPQAQEIIQTEKAQKTGVLEINNVSLGQLPIDLLEMPWLKTVSFKENLISKIEFLDELKELEKLDLASNQISKIENVGHLINLQVLDFSNNEIEIIEEISLLGKLDRLELPHNKLVDIKTVQHNVNLRVLGVSNNSITSLEGIETLKKLEILYAAHNELEDIEPLRSLPLLHRIVLTDNRIRSIKPMLLHIKAGLNLAYEYSFKEEEDGIFVKDNITLNEPSIETIQNGRDAILKYFEDADVHGVQKLEVFKLVLVGNSRVGKTNLSQFLRKKKVDHDSKSTHLLDIQGWNAPFLKSPKDTLTHVKIFDFGGQDYYHDSHRIYYSHDTAYVLLWDKKTNKYDGKPTDVHPKSGEEIQYENYPLEYWLESISYNIEKKELPVFKDAQGNDIKRAAGKTAPVLVIQNKIDEGEAMLDQITLSSKYANIWGFFSMSLLNGKRTQILPQVLSDYLYALDLSGRLLVKFEIGIVQHFLNSKEPLRIMSLDEFWQLCITIISDDTVTYNRDNSIIIAQTLSNVGVVLFEKTAENDGIVYSNIQELNQLVKDVMEVARAGNDKGIFSREQVKRIGHFDAVIQLLLRNNSIIEINDNEFLAPQFLPKDPDPSIQFFLHSFSYTHMRFVYKAYFHKTLLLNLFAKYLKGQHIDTSTGVKQFPFWRNGIIVKRENPTAGTREMVLVEFEKNDAMGVVNIRTMRPFNNIGLEREIEETLDELSKGWTYEKQVSIDSKQFFSVKDLQKSAADKQYSFVHAPNVFNTDKNYWASLNSPTTLSAVSLAGFSRNFTANDFKHLVPFDALPKKLFISYSSKNALFVKRFVTHLETLKTNKLIDPWYDRMIESGTRWDDAIRAEMDLADVVIFMLSPDFLATEYIMKEEVPMAIGRYKLNKSKFYLIKLLPCNWLKTDLKQFQQIDDPTNPEKNIISINTADNDAAWVNVISDLEDKLSPPKV